MNPPLRRLWKDKVALAALIFVLMVVSSAVAAPLVSPHDPTRGAIANRLKPPCWVAGGDPEYLLGTDQQGRDVLSRIIWGGRVSLTVGFVCVMISGAFGTVLGLISGYLGKWADTLIMRIVDIQSSFPGLLVALTFVMVLGPGEWNLIAALTFNGWMVHARMARSQVLSMRETTMVEAARAVGCSTAQTLFGHIFPNILSPLITTYVLEVARIIGAEATMSFLGYGIQPPQSSWGLMIGEGRVYITQAWWLVTFPGVAIALTILCLNLVGNWVRTEMDPLHRSRH
ncbi:MAG: ABC transporter permease [Firmicutes bacterium]|jgi:peptide/nickel transport system permease protein|nr:ABC transporter permease [Bacillota bacterium]